MLCGARSAVADETRSLTRDAALRLAAERNAALMVSSLERARLDAVADTARRPYLPELTIESAARENAAGADKQRAIDTVGTLSYASPYGQSISVAGTLTTGLTGSQQNARSLTIEVSQALLRGGFHPGGGADLRQADLDVKIARELYRNQLNQLLRQTDRAYWDFAFAREDVEIRRRSRDRARAQFEETRENIRRGLLAPGEIYVVEENVVNFDDSLIRAEETLALAESALRRLLNVPPTTTLIASSSIDTSLIASAPEAESLGIAAAKHPAVIAAKLAADRADVGIGADVRRSLPQLDVFGSFGISSSTTNDLLQNVPGERQIRGGLRLSLPVYWGPDTARVRRARTELTQRRCDVRDAENAAATAVHDAATRIRAREQRLELTARLLELAQKKLDVEREKYKSGLSTLADVVRFQRDLDTASSNALRARVDLLAARTEMLAARGDLHESLQVTIR
ncbi:outer membrane efflux protein [Minicystis rosea]|nr:outer membrane efflux protein [Minicystis rosea]